ncbi:MAG TPA: polyphosphate kinase 2 family protein [Pyrinomonadaceae bacterium]|jgi:PPK2 family polyphosphate:nucleotide phosphotransferase
MDYDQFKVSEDEKFNLRDQSTDFSGDYVDKKQAKEDLTKNVKRLAELQDVFYAANKKALLIIFQAMDAAGKDGAIKHVMSGLNPQGVQVYSFKQPSAEELDHDFLWRCAKNTPERGRIGIFNRSYYEEVLIVRVHPEILQSQPLSEELKNDKNIWKKRFEQIRCYETYLAENDVHILKFFLNVSKEEQKNRFLARIETPEKNWKFSASDAKERAFWDDYMLAYEEAIAATSTEKAPWYVIPADKKWFTRVAVSEIIIKKLLSMNLQYPQVSEEHRQNLLKAKELLENEN